MEYQVIPDFLYLNEPIYRRVTGDPQARLVSSGIGHAVNVEPAIQPGISAAAPLPNSFSYRLRNSIANLRLRPRVAARYDPMTMSIDDMEYQVIPDFLYLNEPIYRRIQSDGVPLARLVSSEIRHAVNVLPASQPGISAAAAPARARASEPGINTQSVPLPRNDSRTMSIDDMEDMEFNNNIVPIDVGERLVFVSYTNEGMQGVLDPANINRVYYQNRWRLPGSTEIVRVYSRLGTLKRHSLRNVSDRYLETQLFFSTQPNIPHSIFSLLYDPSLDVPTTATATAPAPAPAPRSEFRRQGGYKRSTTTTSRNKKKKLIRRTRRQNRSRK